MKKTAFIFITVLLMHTGFSQTNNASQNTLDSISKIVIHYLQAKEDDSLYALAGETFKSQITHENFKSISETQIFPINDFQKVTYVSTSNGISKYKVAGTPDLQLLIGIDAESKLETLLIQPFSNN
ncbi:MAG: hypothetical protein ABJB05_12710 [Parafilimonas sp.]